MLAHQPPSRGFRPVTRPGTVQTDGPDAHPCTANTRGLLQPLTVEAEQIQRVGKEAGRLVDAEDAPDPHDRVEVYNPRLCRGCQQPVDGRRQWCTEACRKRSSRQATHRRVGCPLLWS